jgi:hypothetical protein
MGYGHDNNFSVARPIEDSIREPVKDQASRSVVCGRITSGRFRNL